MMVIMGGAYDSYTAGAFIVERLYYCLYGAILTTQTPLKKNKTSKAGHSYYSFLHKYGGWIP